MLHDEDTPKVNGHGHRSRSSSATMKREELERAYAEAVEEARVAAQIGQQLLEKNQENSRVIEALISERDNALTQTNSFKSETENLRSQLALLMRGQQKQSQDELKALTVKTQLYKQQLEEAERVNRQLLDDITKLEQEKPKIDTKERDRERERSRALQQQFDQSQARVHSLEQTEAELRRTLAKAVADREKLELELSERKMEVLPQREPPTDHGVIKKLQEELRATTARLEERERVIRELNTLKAKLEEAVAGLALDHERAVSERADAMRVLDESRAQIASLRQAIDEERMRASIAGGPAGASSNSTAMPSSLLGEIEQALENRIQQVSHHSTPTSDLDSNAERNQNGGASPFLSRKDLPADTQSSQEYFFLAAAAIKIALAIKHPEYDSEWIFRLQVPEAFTRAMRAHVPFHEWYPWLYNHFSNALKEKLRLKRAQQAPASAAAPTPAVPSSATSVPSQPPQSTPSPQPAIPRELELRSYASLQELPASRSSDAVSGKKPDTATSSPETGFLSFLKKIATEY